MKKALQNVFTVILVVFLLVGCSSSKYEPATITIEDSGVVKISNGVSINQPGNVTALIENEEDKATKATMSVYEVTNENQEVLYSFMYINSKGIGSNVWGQSLSEAQIDEFVGEMTNAMVETIKASVPSSIVTGPTISQEDVKSETNKTYKVVDLEYQIIGVGMTFKLLSKIVITEHTIIALFCIDVDGTSDAKAILEQVSFE